MSCLALVPDSRFLPMYILLSRGFGSSDLVCAIGKGDSAGALAVVGVWQNSKQMGVFPGLCLFVSAPQISAILSIPIILEVFLQSQYRSHRLKSQSHKILPLSLDAKPRSKLSLVFLIYLLHIRGSWEAILRFEYLLELLTELRETLLLSTALL